MTKRFEWPVRPQFNKEIECVPPAAVYERCRAHYGAGIQRQRCQAAGTHQRNNGKLYCAAHAFNSRRKK